MENAQSNTDENLENSLQTLKSRNEKLEEMLKRAYIIIQALEQRISIYEKPKNGYDKSWTWITKSVFIITREDKPLRSSELIAQLLLIDPALGKIQKSTEKYISAVLNTAMKYQRLVPYKLKGVRGNYYCLPEWIDENGVLLPEMRKKIY